MEIDTMKARHGTSAPRTGFARAPVALCAALAFVAGCSDSDSDPIDADTMSEDPPGVASTPGGEEGTTQEPTMPETVPGTTFGGADGIEGLEIVTPAGTPDDVTTPWLVYADLFGNPSSSAFTRARAELLGYEQDKPFTDHVEFYTDSLDRLDTCLIRDLAATDGTAGSDGDEDENPFQVSGGQTLLLSTPAGSFAEIPRIDDPGNVYYEAVNTFPGPVPGDATLSIPGDVFPTVDAYPILPVQRPERLAPLAGEALTSTTVYRWVPGTDDTSIKLDFFAEDAATGDFIGFPVTCYPRDDGEFELTDEAIDALVTAPGDIGVRFSRLAARLELRDDISFIIFNELAE